MLSNQQCDIVIYLIYFVITKQKWIILNTLLIGISGSIAIASQISNRVVTPLPFLLLTKEWGRGGYRRGISLNYDKNRVF